MNVDQGLFNRRVDLMLLLSIGLSVDRELLLMLLLESLLVRLLFAYGILSWFDHLVRSFQAVALQFLSRTGEAWFLHSFVLKDTSIVEFLRLRLLHSLAK